MLGEALNQICLEALVLKPKVLVQEELHVDAELGRVLERTELHLQDVLRLRDLGFHEVQIAVGKTGDVDHLRAPFSVVSSPCRVVICAIAAAELGAAGSVPSGFASIAVSAVAICPSAEAIFSSVVFRSGLVFAM
jgi:hypothetical protein